MSNNKAGAHTQGEWLLDTTSKPYKINEKVSQTNFKTICYLPAKYPNFLESDTDDFKKRVKERDKINKQNGKLIAAAPDMLEALKFAKSVLLAGGCYERSEQLAVENIESAIKKATK